ncbi:MAG: hypothetical protein CMJ49_08790 [Planctomycetaceae bacterium]|nr:hypothetical protein [Planctomycetaceae bacterium]
MLGTGIEVFLQFPHETEQRILHPGKVVEVSDGACAAEFFEPDLSPEPGMEVLIYHEIRNKFVKQPARIDAVLGIEPQPVIGFATTGEAVPADDRECFRVSTAIAEIAATLCEEQNCPVVDVSLTGLAIIADGQYNVGQSLPVTITFEDETYDGTAIVQNIKDLRQRRTRYGLSCAGDKIDGGNLEKGVHKIGLAVQRQHLRRRAGAQTGA